MEEGEEEATGEEEAALPAAPVNTGAEIQEPLPEEEAPDTEDPYATYFSTNLETEEVQAAIELVEFKMEEITIMIEECIKNKFADDLMADVYEILDGCAGVNNSI